jgi:hypothetical protein
MGSNQAQSLGLKRGPDIFLAAPEQLTIVQDDPKHLLYNERPEVPEEATVKDYMARGVHTPIKVRRAGTRDDGTPILEVVCGTQRVRGAIIANARLRETGREEIHVKVEIVRGDEADIMGLMISENEHRRASGPLSKAHLAQRYLNLGRSVEDTCTTFKVTGVTLRNWLALLECCSEVKAAVDSGHLAAVAAVELNKLDHDAQRTALAQMLESGATKGHAAREAAENATKGKPAKVEVNRARMKSRRFLERARDELVECKSDDECKLVLNAFRFALGEVELRVFPANVREAIKPLLSKKAAKKDA